MSEYKYITYGVADGLATLTLNKPPFNVLDIPMMVEINDALDRLLADQSARVLLIAAAGEKAFSAGVEVADHTPDKVDRMIEVFHGIFRRLENVTIPVIGALNGVALGGGCELALGCDMIIAASNAKLGQPEIKLGVFPPIAAIMLPRLLPPTKAAELLLGGNNIDAIEAHRLGLINKVVAKEEFADATKAFVDQFLGLSRPALVYTKKAMRAAAGKPFNEALDAAETIYLKELMPTADANEGLNSFLQKRPPVWQHK
ncbi:enoyl-CoA hydratase [Herbaspirillum sp. HC18]|nr:enoyl-CoA hydratase [Herbaspirillum sp. HC18]